MAAPATTIVRTGSFLVRASVPSVRKSVPSTATASYTTAAPRSISKEVCTKYRYLNSTPSLQHSLTRRFAGSDRTTVRCLSGLGGSSGDHGDRAGPNKWAVPGSSPNTPTVTVDRSTSRPASAPTPMRISLGGSSWDSIKDDINEELINPPEDSQANIAANLKKLEAISKVLRRKQAYSPYLIISQLPSTVMPDDIQRMAVSEDSIVDIIYHRNQFMEFLNRVTVVFKSATDAVEFLTQRYGKFLAGHKLKMSMLDPYEANDKRWIPPQLKSEPFSGQMVLVSGLPAASRPDHIRTEFRRFQLMDTTEAAIIPIPSKRMASTCQYLIRLSSRSEAFRFVRTYHNSFYQYQEFRKRCPIRATVIY